MFSVVSVWHSVQGGSHLTITHGELDLTVQGPLPRPLHTWYLTVQGHLPASDIWGPSVETCSNLFASVPAPLHQCWHLVDIESYTSGQYASYRNAFLFQIGIDLDIQCEKHILPLLFSILMSIVSNVLFTLHRVPLTTSKKMQKKLLIKSGYSL